MSRRSDFTGHDPLLRFRPKANIQFRSAFATIGHERPFRAAVRYYFHLHNDVDVSDESGKDLPDLEAARAHAIRMAQFEVSEAATRDGRIVLSHRIDVEDENGSVLATVLFRDAVQIMP